MRRAIVRDCDLVPWGSNYTFAVLLEDPDEEFEEQISIYKPAAGEIPLWDFPDDTLYRREYCAFLVSRALNWNFIPTTVIRDGPHGIGSVQEYVEPVQDAHYFSLRDTHRDALMELAIFDIVTNNADRKAGHCLLGSEDDRVWGIDHGLTFNVEAKLRTVIWDFQLEKVPTKHRDALVQVSNDTGLIESLRPHLTSHEIRAFQLRCQRLAKVGVFPPLQSRRNIPWGW